MVFFTYAHATGTNDDVGRLGSTFKSLARGLQGIGNTSEVINLTIQTLQQRANRVTVGVVNTALGQRLAGSNQLGTGKKTPTRK